jgi:phospholipid/cholesterol/gamma-HCH transport system ATP-binding protein
MAGAFKVATRIVMLYEGKILFEGTPEEIQRSEVPTIRRFVTGDATQEELASLE